MAATMGVSKLAASWEGQLSHWERNKMVRIWVEENDGYERCNKAFPDYKSGNVER